MHLDSAYAKIYANDSQHTFHPTQCSVKTLTLSVMMAVVIQHSFGSTCRLQGSVDSLGIAIGITQAVVVAFALPDTILQINLCGVFFGDMFLYEIGNTRIPERPTEGKYCSKGICFPETHGCSQTAQRIAAIRQLFRVKGVFVYKRRENFVVQFSMILS